MLGFTAFWLVSAPRPLPASAIPAHAGNIANGEILYTAGGCRNCHKSNAEQAGLDPDLPSGGFPLKTPIGVLYPPNLTPDAETGIGNWSDLDFVNAVQRGISKSGQHLIPAFPYTSYAAMPVEDVLDIKAYLMSLPPVSSPSREAGIPIAFLLRRGLGLWKFLGLDTAPWQPDSSQTATWNRGSYLVNGPGHCGECHTPRNSLGGFETAQWLAGAPNPEGEGRIPNITPGSKSIGSWSEGDIVNYLETGFTPEFDSAGGSMVEVQQNMAKLPASDREAIAAYLKAVPVVE